MDAPAVTKVHGNVVAPIHEHEVARLELRGVKEHVAGCPTGGKLSRSRARNGVAALGKGPLHEARAVRPP